MEAPGVEPPGDNKHRAGLRVFPLGSIRLRRTELGFVWPRPIKLGNEWATTELVFGFLKARQLTPRARCSRFQHTLSGAQGAAEVLPRAPRYRGYRGFDSTRERVGQDGCQNACLMDVLGRFLASP